MRRLLHRNTLVVQRVSWVEHEHSVLTELPGHVIVEHNCRVLAVGNRIVARVFADCGRSCRHTGDKRLSHEL
jgi:hypothetical protein